ncbi:hypothetical protein KIN20_025419 [Parelaphostrongylus tenuis]|uniref:Uncharacterized protein n=1 Tax=Parelaphostrongylus tenuis TaxID=148309 RepID=A0AAD5QWM4_PARTN|nr:hypothetical protein KIN20_025419 [Parelaphostrongylus tenuis]
MRKAIIGDDNPEAMRDPAEKLTVLSLGTSDRLTTILRRQLGHVTNFVVETFEEFASLDIEEQVKN